MWPFKKKNKTDLLYDLYRSKLAEAHKMSAINRSKSDQILFEADQILKQIENENG